MIGSVEYIVPQWFYEIEHLLVFSVVAALFEKTTQWTKKMKKNESWTKGIKLTTMKQIEKNGGCQCHVPCLWLMFHGNRSLRFFFMHSSRRKTGCLICTLHFSSNLRPTWPQLKRWYRLLNQNVNRKILGVRVYCGHCIIQWFVRMSRLFVAVCSWFT